MTAATLDIVIEQGATWDRQLLWREAVPPNSDPGTLGDLKDLTGASAHMQVRVKPGGSMLAELTSAAGITLGGTAGTIDILMTGAQTMALNVKTAYYDLYVIFPGDDPRKVITGKVTIIPTVTSPVELP